MKKSKFLRSSKDMLSRSFNSSKCKTSLRLASSRLKLLRNKKEVQVKQMRREISLLLESGQDPTARIRVEHVIREEKMVAAYDLIGIYCELIVARLPIIETQKICPIDLKEAIASIVFASSRCGDVPELADIKKQFTEKYGKDFTTAAIEVRPECGVSRMLVEKLSAVAPDGQTKIKFLTAIAEEYNVEWDAKSFGQNSIPANNLPSVPSTFVKESERPIEPSHSQAPEKASLSNQLRDSTLNFTQADHRTSLGTERPVSRQGSGFNSSFQHEARLHGGERASLFRGDSNNSPHDRQRWSMEFKDATSAAQAAAESAELASMAARAAAELSTRERITRQYSTESCNSNDHSLRDETADTYTRSKLGSEQFSQDSTNRSFPEHSRLQNEQIDRRNLNNTGGRFEADRDSRKEYSHSSSNGDDSTYHGVLVVDRDSRKNSLKEASRDEKSMQRLSFKNRAAAVFDKSDSDTENYGFDRSPTYDSRNLNNTGGRFEADRDSRKEYSHSSSLRSKASNGDDSTDHGVPVVDRDSRKNSLKEALRGEKSMQRPSFKNRAAAVFDRSDSDTENYGFDRSPTYDEPQHFSTITDSWSPKSSSSKTEKSSASVFVPRKSSSSDFPERSMKGSKLDVSTTVAFDESDGRSSESDGDMKISRDSRISRNFLGEQNQSVGLQFQDKSMPAFGSPHKRSPQYDQTQLDGERNQGKKFDANPPVKFNLAKPSSHHPTLVAKTNRTELNDFGNSSPEREEGLNFGKLTGGFRHKGYNYPSFEKNQFDVSRSKKESKATTDTFTMVERKNTKPDPTSDTDSSEEEDDYLQKSSDHKHKLYTLRGGKDLKTKPSFAASNSIFGSKNSDLDEDLPKESLRITSRLHSGISRRTKTYPSHHEKEKYSKLKLRSEALDPDDGMDGKATTSTGSETPKRYETKRNSSKLENYEQHSSMKVALDHAKPKSWGSSLYQQSSGKADSGIIQESKVSAKSGASEEASLPQRKSEPNLKTEMLNKTNSDKDSSNRKASHVHPKLPDYATYFNSFRKIVLEVVLLDIYNSLVRFMNACEYIVS